MYFFFTRLSLFCYSTSSQQHLLPSLFISLLSFQPVFLLLSFLSASAFSGRGDRPQNMVLTPLSLPPTPSHPHSNLATVYSCIDPIHPLYQPCRSFPSSEAVVAATGMRGEKMLTHCPAMIGNVEHIRYVLRRKSN